MARWQQQTCRMLIAICRFLVLLALSAGAHAQTPSILLEACNAMEPASKRLDCLRAANASAPAGQRAAVNTPNAAYQRPPTAAASPSTASQTSGGQTCYVGPRGGTYTITASGRKNYSGC